MKIHMVRFGLHLARKAVDCIMHLPAICRCEFSRLYKEWRFQTEVHLAAENPSKYYSESYFLNESGGCEYIGTGEIPGKFKYAISLFAEDLCSKRVLDFASGRGEFAGFLATQGADVLGVDVSPSAVSLSSRSYPKINFRRIAVNQVPSGPFDYIFLMDVVEHMKKPDVRTTLTKLAGQLSPNGSMCIHTNDADQDDKPEIKAIHPEHISLFTTSELAQYMVNAGCRVDILLRRQRDEHGYVGGLWCVGTKTDKFKRKYHSRVLIEYEATVGDQLCLTPAIAEYRRRNPNCYLTIKVTHPEIYINNPNIDEIVWCQAAEPERNYDVVHTINLPVAVDHRKMSLQNASAAQLGFELSGDRHPPQIFISEIERRIWQQRFQRPRKLLVAIAPYSGWISKEWSFDKWRVVTDYLIEKHDAVIICLGKNDRPYPWLGFNMMGLTDLRELALTLEQCDLLLTIDNGIMHMAAAVGTPTVAIFGPVLGRYLCHDYCNCMVVQSTDCFGCYNTTAWTEPPRVCPLKHHKCMRDISPEMVIAACDSHLAHHQNVAFHG